MSAGGVFFSFFFLRDSLGGGGDGDVAKAHPRSHGVDDRGVAVDPGVGFVVALTTWIGHRIGS